MSLSLHALPADGAPDPSEEFVSLLTQHQRVLLAFILGLVPDRNDAEDIRQRTNIMLWRKREDFQSGTSFCSWAFSVARWEAKGFLRERGRKSWLVYDDDVATHRGPSFRVKPPSLWSLCPNSTAILAIAVLAASGHPSDAQRVNFTKFQQVAANVANATYVADFAVDGIASNFHSWRTGNNPGPHWLEITYPRPVTLASAHLYSGLLNATTSQVWQNFRFQYHDGTGWIDIPGSTVAGNTLPEVNIVFSSPATSTRFRLLGSDTGSRTLRELAMFPPNPDDGGGELGFPIGADVTLNLAYQRPAVASSINGANFAIHAVDGHVDDSSRWWCDGGTPGQTLEIDLLTNHAIGSAHAHSGNFSNPGDPNPLAAFTLEYHDGTTWQPIPGATITGNTSTTRVIALPHQTWNLVAVPEKPNHFRILNQYSGLALRTQGSWDNGTPMIVATNN